jgi:hypothetical protein|tara:strand:- start:202 stop:495 length:294 start_codon:yes stop_codon:yes gene_type:complete
MNDKFLLFQNAANDCMVYPLSKLKSVEAASTALNFTFDTIAGEDVLTVTCSAAEHDQMVKLAEFLGGPAHTDGVYVIADDVNSVYAVDGFTAVGAAS